jgi:hypothetical protein
VSRLREEGAAYPGSKPFALKRDTASGPVRNLMRVLAASGDLLGASIPTAKTVMLAGNSVEQSTSMPDQGDTKILEILGRQARQYRCVDLVVAERLFVPLQPETVEPCRYVHALLLPSGYAPLVYHIPDCLCA